MSQYIELIIINILNYLIDIERSKMHSIVVSQYYNYKLAAIFMNKYCKIYNILKIIFRLTYKK